MRETATFKTFNSSLRGAVWVPYQLHEPRMLLVQHFDASQNSHTGRKKKNKIRLCKKATVNAVREMSFRSYQLDHGYN